jgi:hypothetical protein
VLVRATAKIRAAYLQGVAPCRLRQPVEIVDAHEIHTALRGLRQVEIETMRAHGCTATRRKLR